MPYQYTGRYTEAATGLVNLDARWYNPHTQRFVQPDLWNFRNTGLPSEIQHELMRFTGLDTYQLLRDPSQQVAFGYVSGNPLAWTDWLGLCETSLLQSIKQGASSLWSGVKNVVGKTWNLPNTVVGLGVSTLVLSADLIQSTVMTIVTRENQFQNIGFSIGNNAIQIKTGLNLFGNTDGGLTIGNVILYNNSDPADDIISPYQGSRIVNLGRHERRHTYQGERLGVLYIPTMIKEGIASPNNSLEVEADDHSLVGQ